jgi:hypothetical protein
MAWLWPTAPILRKWLRCEESALELPPSCRCAGHLAHSARIPCHISSTEFCVYADLAFDLPTGRIRFNTVPVKHMAGCIFAGTWKQDKIRRFLVCTAQVLRQHLCAADAAGRGPAQAKPGDAPGVRPAEWHCLACRAPDAASHGGLLPGEEYLL